ncbi:MAG TPA: hypothetical protein DDW42_10370 [Desulfobacteraceae bacterium]|nr:hypothetical protein [Desulfobacteraceae bacterium]
MDTKERIMNKVEVKANGCWIWTGAKGKGGYGNSWYNGRYVNTHRLMYQLEIGPIPKGRNVCHSCDNCLCVNPEHLYVATQKKNLEDMRLKGRQSQGKAHSKAIKEAWTPELREYRSKQTKERRRQEHNKKADAAGVPRDWKYCPGCKQWFPRSNFHKNAARHDGLKPHCRTCASKMDWQRQKRKKSMISL